MRERMLAVVGAVGLIVAAVFLRSVLAGDDPSSNGGAGKGDAGGAGAPVVACTPDLQSVCSALEETGTITAAPTLELAAAASPDLAVDAWITWDPAPGVANFDLPDTWIDVEPLAAAPLGVLVASGPWACDPTTWATCVVPGAERGVPVGVGNGRTAQSLARLHPVAAALVPDGGDFRGVSPLTLRTVLESTQVRQDDYARQLTTFLTQRGALNSVIGPVPVLEGAAARQTSATVVVPDPAAAITVVVATHRPSIGDRGSVTAERLLASEPARSALEALGLAPGRADLPDPRRAGEVHVIREKVS